MRKPFFWKARNGWYIKENGSNVPLHKDEKEALRIWLEMQELEEDDARFITTPAVIESYLNHVEKLVNEKSLAQSTYDLISYYLIDFASEYDKKLARKLKVNDVTKWTDKHPRWGAASRRQAIASIKRALAWAEEEELILPHRITRMKKPGTKRRDVLIPDDTHARLMAAADDNSQPRRRGRFRAFLVALSHTGARPGSIAAVQVPHVSEDGTRWVLPDHKTRNKTMQPLTVYLDPCMQTLTRILISGRKTGHLFLDSQNKPWTSNAVRCRMRRYREKLDLPAGSVAYSYRHTFITNALTSGNNTATVAELVNHSDGSMISKHYGHLEKCPDHLLSAAEKVANRKKKPR
jgi:integrase